MAPVTGRARNGCAIDMNTIAARLGKALADSGITKAELARRANLTPAAITFLLNGDSRDVQGANVFPIADALGVSARWLVTGKHPREIDGATPASLDPDAVRLAQALMLADPAKRQAVMALLDL